MTTMESLMQAALAAPEERREQALKVLKGEPVGRTVTGPLLMGMGAGAKFLGCSRSTLWRILQAGTIDKVELFPGSFRVRREDLMALAAGEFGCSGKVSRRGRPRKRETTDHRPQTTDLKDPRFLDLMALADGGDECAASDLFKEFGYDHTAGGFTEPRTVRTDRTNGTRLCQGYGGQARGTHEEPRA